MSRRTAAKGRQPEVKRRTLWIIGVIAIVAAAALLLWYACSNAQERSEAEIQEGLKDIFEGSASAPRQAPLISLMPAAVAEELSAVADRKISDRLVELYQINPELIGWLKVGEEISTPVVYRDNKFYLEHDFYGNTSSSGTVFADVKNVNWETDPYIVLYGHNMRNGTMFGTLDEFQALEHLVENSGVEFFSLYDDEVLQFIPFAVVDASMNKGEPTYLKLRNFSAFDDLEDLTAAEAFLEELVERSMFEIPGIDVATDDRVIALTTCSYKLPNARLTVFCRQLREGETLEALQEQIRLNAKAK